MLLSISMIVKNEEKNIENCLRALKVLEKDLNIEIIIVDTGSEDNTINIAKKYTDKIFFHKWENDFAKMRNISLSYCKGDWVLVVDADEELVNPKAVVDFFCGNIHKKFTSAFVKIRSILSEGDTTEISSPILRMCKMTPETRFEGKMHEQLKCEAPYFKTDIEFKHNGYIADDYKLRIRKFKRTKMLFDELNGNLNKIYVYYQLYVSYKMINREEGIKFLVKSEELAKKSKNPHKYIYVFNNKAIVLYDFGKYKEALELVEYTLKYVDINIDAIYIAACACIKMHNYKQAKIYIHKYLTLIEDKKNIDELNQIGLELYYSNKKEHMIEEQMIILYIEQAYAEIIEIFLKEEKEETKLRWYKIFIESCFNKKEYRKLVEGLKSIELKDYIIDYIIFIMNRNILLCSQEEMKIILDILKDIDERIYIYLKIVYNDTNALNEEEMINYYISKINNNNYIIDALNKNTLQSIDLNEYALYKAEILKRIFDNEEYIFNILENLNKDVLLKYLEYFKEDFQIIDSLIRYQKKNFMTTDERKVKVIISIGEILIDCSCITEKDMEEIFFTQLIERKTYTKKSNSLDKLEEVRENSFWNKLYYAIGKASDDLYGSINDTKNLAKDFQMNSKALKIVAKFLNVSPISDEMSDHKEQILNNVVELINSGDDRNLREAKEILVEIKGMFRFDYRIYNLLGVIKFLAKNYYEALFEFNMAILFNAEDYDSIYSIGEVLIDLNRNQDAMGNFEEIISKCNGNNELIYESRKRIEEIKYNQ